MALNEESSGIIDVTNIFDATEGSGRYFILTNQAHYLTGNPLTVEGGQRLLMHIPEPGSLWLIGAAITGWRSAKRCQTA